MTGRTGWNGRVRGHSNDRMPAFKVTFPPRALRTCRPCFFQGKSDPVISQHTAADIMRDGYARLRRLARRIVREERGHTLQPTAAVHEAYLHLRDVPAQDLQHYFELTARSIRRLLVEQARRRRRTGDAQSIDVLGDLGEAGSLPSDATPQIDVVDLDRALAALAVRAPSSARLLELHYFGGLGHVEIAAICGLSEVSVERECRCGRAFLLSSLRQVKAMEFTEENRRMRKL